MYEPCRYHISRVCIMLTRCSVATVVRLTTGIVTTGSYDSLSEANQWSALLHLPDLVTQVVRT